MLGDEDRHSVASRGSVVIHASPQGEGPGTENDAVLKALVDEVLLSKPPAGAPHGDEAPRPRHARSLSQEYQSDGRSERAASLARRSPQAGGGRPLSATKASGAVAEGHLVSIAEEPRAQGRGHLRGHRRNRSVEALGIAGSDGDDEFGGDPQEADQDLGGLGSGENDSGWWGGAFDSAADTIRTLRMQQLLKKRSLSLRRHRYRQIGADQLLGTFESLYSLGEEGEEGEEGDDPKSLSFGMENGRRRYVDVDDGVASAGAGAGAGAGGGTLEAQANAPSGVAALVMASVGADSEGPAELSLLSLGEGAESGAQGPGKVTEGAGQKFVPPTLLGVAENSRKGEGEEGRGGKRPSLLIGSQAPVGKWNSAGEWMEDAALTEEPEIPNSLQQIPPGDLVRVKELGRGQFGAVWHQRWRGVDVAVKEMHNAGINARREMLREAATLATLRHPCVVGFFGVIITEDLTATVLEYVRDGNLRTCLKGPRFRSMVEAAEGGDAARIKVSLALSAARGMEYLHSQSIVHFDLKADNLLCDLSNPRDPYVKVGDLGLSKQKANTFVSGNMRGTLPWMAPELFGGMARDAAPPAEGPSTADQAEDDGNVTEKVDVFSFGVVMWEIWQLGATPYQDKTMPQVLQGVMSGVLRPGVPGDCPARWAGLMERCWGARASTRPSFSEICVELEGML